MPKVYNLHCLHVCRSKMLGACRLLDNHIAPVSALAAQTATKKQPPPPIALWHNHDLICMRSKNAAFHVLDMRASARPRTLPPHRRCHSCPAAETAAAAAAVAAQPAAAAAAPPGRANRLAPGARKPAQQRSGRVCTTFKVSYGILRKRQAQHVNVNNTSHNCMDSMTVKASCERARSAASAARKADCSHTITALSQGQWAARSDMDSAADTMLRRLRRRGRRIKGGGGE